ncbi:MAG: CcmD family protein [Crocinitomicaceae bacterium]|nr:CcmD family protein [Crocinitomicaceae bacterium]
MAILSGGMSFAQEAEKPEMATGLKSNGMIYIVVIVLLIVFAGIVFYLITIDRKLNRIEKELKK